MNHTRLAFVERSHISDIAKSFGNEVVAAIYFDDTMSSFSVINNTIINTDYAVLVHGGRDNGKRVCLLETTAISLARVLCINLHVAGAVIYRNSFISARHGVFLAPDGIPTHGFNKFQMWVATRAYNEVTEILIHTA